MRSAEYFNKNPNKIGAHSLSNILKPESTCIQNKFNTMNIQNPIHMKMYVSMTSVEEIIDIIKFNIKENRICLDWNGLKHIDEFSSLTKNKLECLMSYSKSNHQKYESR